MPDWHRRTVLATGATLSTSGVLASINSTTAEMDDDRGEVASSGSASVGDSDGWSSAWGNASNANYLPLENEFPEPDTVAWRFDLSNPNTYHDGMVAVVDDRVYLLSDHESTDGGGAGYESTLYALDADDGDLEWKTDVVARYRPTVANGMVYVSASDHVTAFDAADGSLQWEREIETTDEWVPSTTAEHGALYVVGGGRLYALDGDDGSIRWEREQVEVRPETEMAGDPVTTRFSAVPVAVVDGTVYAKTGDATFEADGSETFESTGGVAAIDSTTGDDRWGIALEEGAFNHLRATEAFVVAVKNPAATTSGSILDPETGDPVEKVPSLTRAATPEVRVQHDPSGFPGKGPITVISNDARESWTASDVSFNAPLIGGDTLIAIHGDPDSVTGFDLESGAVKWRLECDSSPVGLVAIDENTLYADIDDELVALRASDEPDEDEETQSDESDTHRARQDEDRDRTDDTDSDC